MSQILGRGNETIGSALAEPVVVLPKTMRRFYEAVILLRALNEGYQGTANRKSRDLHHCAGEDSDEDLFRNFVARLGQICDSRPGGFTATAFVVLQHPEKVEYVFGSNRRKSVELEITRVYIHSILTSLRKLETCIAICGEESSTTVVARQKSFVVLLELVLSVNQSVNDDDEFLDRTEELINALHNLQKTVIASYLRKRASNDMAGNTEPWREVQHHSSRLLAYRRAVEVLWDSGSMWPSLLDSFEVTCIPSSIKASNPLSTSPQTASEILTRMIPTSFEAKGRYLELADIMQQTFELDKVIEDQWTSNLFRPVVHAEILIHNWLEYTGGTRPERFFRNWQYIGCSKPVCKLCHYYFSSHPSGVQIRGTHGNLYRNWRMPDYADAWGLRTKEEALAKRHEILQTIMGHIRRDVLRTLSEKSTDSRPCDSSTISSFPLNDGLTGMIDQHRSSLVPRTHLKSLVGAQAVEPRPWGFNDDWDTIDGESETKDSADESVDTNATRSVI